MSMKIPMTPTGIEQATFGFVAQRLNHCATAVPLDQVVTPVTCIRKLPGSDPGQCTDYHTYFRCSPHSLQTNAGRLFPVSSMALPSMSSPTHCQTSCDSVQ